MQNKILHIFNKNNEKFSKGYFEFLRDNNFNLNKHILFHYGKDKGVFDDFNFSKYFAGSFLNPISNIKLLKYLFSAEKIIVHCLASPALLLYLYLFPSLCEKVYWVVWGKDLYFYKLLEKPRFYHKIYEFFRKKVIKNIGHILTYIEGDYKLLNKWYNNNGKYHECLMYISNVYKPLKIKVIEKDKIVIQIGNSADPSNNHEEIFNKLTILKEENIEIIVPLVYGDKCYANKIKKMGKLFFGNKFKPLTNMLSFKEYTALLGKIDVAFFNHERQQAMGNIITLLGLGKKVYIKSNITSWELFEKLKVKVYNIDNLNLEKIKNNVKKENIKKIKLFFSRESLSKQWKDIIK